MSISSNFWFFLLDLDRLRSIIGCLHDPANVQQTSSRQCIQNTLANAGRLLDVCWIV